MAVMLRLKKMGTSKVSFYRIVAADSKSPRDGKSIDIIGYYDPKKENAVIKIDREKASYWLGVGAMPTVTVKNLLKREGIEVTRSK